MFTSDHMGATVKQFTHRYVESQKPNPDKPYEVAEPNGSGLRLVVWPSGKKTYIFRYRRPGDGKPAKFTIGQIDLAAARDALDDAKAKLRKKIDPGAAKRAADDKARAAAADTVEAVCEEYISKVASKNLRSWKQQQKDLRRLVYGKIGTRPISSIKRSDCVRLFEAIGEKTPVMADSIRAYLGTVFTWYEGRSDDFRSPITKAIKRQAKPTAERARTRILTDDEIRGLWAKTNTEEPFPALVRFLLLTGCRLREGSEMPRTERTSNGDWLLPKERHKTKRELLRPLSPQARDILDKQPVIRDCPFYFTRDGRKPIESFSRDKKRLDDKLPEDMPHWTLHDLRRTASSLMNRAGVNSDHVERCLGHVIGGVKGTYNRHDYEKEKREAYDALAALIDRIISPPTDNVVPIRA
jgi:integrase